MSHNLSQHIFCLNRPVRFKRFFYLNKKISINEISHQWVFGLWGGWSLSSFFPAIHFPSFCSCATFDRIVASRRPVTTDCDGTTGFAAWSRDDFREGDKGSDTTTGDEQLSTLVSTEKEKKLFLYYMLFKELSFSVFPIQ